MLYFILLMLHVVIQCCHKICAQNISSVTQILLFYSVYSCIIPKFAYDTLYTNIPIFFHIYIIAVTLLLLGHSIYSCVITNFSI